MSNIICFLCGVFVTVIIYHYLHRRTLKKFSESQKKDLKEYEEVFDKYINSIRLLKYAMSISVDVLKYKQELTKEKILVLLQSQVNIVADEVEKLQTEIK